MICGLVLNSLKSSFNLEISNKAIYKKNKIIVELADGTKAEITTKYVD